MDAELKEKLDALDAQIVSQKDVYAKLKNTEAYAKTNSSGSLRWHESTINREKDIFDEIHRLQKVKSDLISGVKPPEIVYIDRETIKYQDRIVKTIYVHKSGLANAFAWIALAIYGLVGLAAYLGYLQITVHMQGKL